MTTVFRLLAAHKDIELLDAVSDRWMLPGHFPARTA